MLLSDQIQAVSPPVVKRSGQTNIFSLLTLCDLALVGFWPCYRAANRQITETLEITTQHTNTHIHQPQDQLLLPGSESQPAVVRTLTQPSWIQTTT